MKKIEKELCALAQTLKGKIIGIGIASSKLLDTIENNDQITECIVLNQKVDLEEGKGHTKRLNIRKLRKKFKKKRIDTILCDADEVASYLKTFVKDTIYITKGSTYFYTENKELIENLKVKYDRYDVTQEERKIGTYYLYHVTVGLSKNHFWKDKWYYIKDTMMNGIDYLSDYLID